MHVFSFRSQNNITLALILCTGVYTLCGDRYRGAEAEAEGAGYESDSTTRVVLYRSDGRIACNSLLDSRV